ncbi:MAG: LptF/LptG family permease [Longimicrobiaceae bacterium]
MNGAFTVKLLDRYLANQFLTLFGYLVLGLPLLFVITDITDNLDSYLDQAIPAGRIALAYLYYLPQFVTWALPVSALMGTVFTIGSMTRHHEIAAAKAGGVSFYRLLVPVVVLGAGLSVVAFGLGELVPVTNRLRAEALGAVDGSDATHRSNFVFQAEGGEVLSVRRLDAPGGEMSRVMIEAEPGSGLPGLHAVADRARWSGDAWNFRDGYLRLFSAGAEQTFVFDSLRMPSVRAEPEELLAEPKDPEEMRYGEMSRFIEAIRRSGGDPNPLKVERDQKLALPVAVLVIILFGAPLSTSSKRGGAAWGVGVSLLTTMVYLLLFRIGTAVGASGTLPPLLAAWMPNLLFAAGAGVLLWRVNT